MRKVELFEVGPDRDFVDFSGRRYEVDPVGVQYGNLKIEVRRYQDGIWADVYDPKGGNVILLDNIANEYEEINLVKLLNAVYEEIIGCPFAGDVSDIFEEWGTLNLSEIGAFADFGQKVAGR